MATLASCVQRVGWIRTRTWSSSAAGGAPSGVGVRCDAGFRAAEWPLNPTAALLDEVLARRRGQPLSIALVALELARRLEIDLQGIGFPGHFLLRPPVEQLPQAERDHRRNGQTDDQGGQDRYALHALKSSPQSSTRSSSARAIAPSRASLRYSAAISAPLATRRE